MTIAIVPIKSLVEALKKGGGDPAKRVAPSNESISQLEKGGGLFVSSQKGNVFPIL